MSNITGPNLVTSGLVFNIDSFKYTAFNIGAKTWTTAVGNTTLAGTLAGTTAWSTSTGAISFPNSGDAAAWPASSLYAFGTGDFTIEVWIFPTSFSNYLHMVALPDQNTFGLKANVTDGQIYFYSTDFTTLGSTTGWTLTLNQWNHVVFKRSSSIAYAYLNGVLIGSKTGFANNFTSQVLNVHNGWPGEFAACQIRNIRIYNQGLSDAQVYQNYIAFQNRVYEPVSFPALTTTLAIATKSIVINVVETGFTPVTSSGGYNGVVWTVSPTLPTGLVLNSVTGSISGTPVGLLSSTSYTLIATDAVGQTSSKTFSFAVTPVPLTTTLDTATVSTYPNVVQNVKPVSAAGGFGTLSYSISPALASGLSLNAASGFITGSYNTTINQSYTVTVTDQATPTPQTSNKAFTLSITTPPALVTTLVQATYNFTTGAQISANQPVIPSGGVPAYTYTVSPALPAGIVLNSSTGIISGEPTGGASSASYTITATDASLQTSAKSVTITIVAALYGFTAFTFTSANLTGRTGPTRTQSLASYDTATNTWLNNTAYFNIVTQGIQQWTVPATGTYRLVLRGADGGGFTGSTFNPRFPGQGATITCDVSLTISTVLNIVVGQTPTILGAAAVDGSGGAGGTWIYTGTIGGGGLIAVAGGGGGWGHGGSATTGGVGLGGSATTDSNRVAVGASVTAAATSTAYTCNGTGATNGIGNGGGLATTGTNLGGAGGAGWLTDGTSNPGQAGGGTRFVGGLSANANTALQGGFGGGGSTNGSGYPGGGGGGYTGGPAANGYSGFGWGNAGGGGSFSTGTLVSAQAGLNGIAYASIANGSVTITKL